MLFLACNLNLYSMRNSSDMKTDLSGSGLDRRSRCFLTRPSSRISLRFDPVSKQKLVQSDQNPVRNAYPNPRTWFIDSISVNLAFLSRIGANLITLITHWDVAWAIRFMHTKPNWEVRNPHADVALTIRFTPSRIGKYAIPTPKSFSLKWKPSEWLRYFFVFLVATGLCSNPIVLFWRYQSDQICSNPGEKCQFDRDGVNESRPRVWICVSDWILIRLDQFLFWYRIEPQRNPTRWSR